MVCWKLGLSVGIKCLNHVTLLNSYMKHQQKLMLFGGVMAWKSVGTPELRQIIKIWYDLKEMRSQCCSIWKTFVINCNKLSHFKGVNIYAITYFTLFLFKLYYIFYFIEEVYCFNLPFFVKKASLYWTWLISNRNKKVKTSRGVNTFCRHGCFQMIWC